MENKIYPDMGKDQESLTSVRFSRYGIIYKFTNLIDNKIYIGQTIKKLYIRVRQHKCIKSSTCSFLSRAIKKYGLSNFLIEEIYTSFSREDLNEKEKYFIKLFNSKAPLGYNLTDGGETNEGLYISKEAKLKASRSRGGKELVAVNIKTGEVKSYDYVRQAEKDGFRNADIYRNLNKKSHQVKGWKFLLKTEYDNLSGSSKGKILEHAQRLETEPTKVDYNVSKRPRFPEKLNHIDKTFLVSKYKELNSTYKTAKFFNVDRDSIKRALLNLNQLNNQSDASSIRNLNRKKT